MTWSKFDDLYDEHEKIEDAWFAFPPNPVGLHVMATTACNRWLSDGVIRPRWLERKLPKQRDREQILTTMVRVGLFDVLPAGESATVVDSDGGSVVLGPFDGDRYLVHDFLERHDSRRQVEDRRARDATRKRGVRRSPTKSPRGVPSDSVGSPSVRVDAGAQPRDRVPTRPDPTSKPPRPPKGGRGRDQERFAEEMAAWARETVPDLPEDIVAGAVQRLRSGNVADADLTVDRIRARALAAFPHLAPNGLEAV